MYLLSRKDLYQRERAAALRMSFCCFAALLASVMVWDSGCHGYIDSPYHKRAKI